MNLIITRYRKKEKTIDGYLTIDGEYICDTAESTTSCLLSGCYPIRIEKCKQYARKMPILITQQKDSACLYPNCIACSLLKSGNGVYRSAQSNILLGTHICPGCLKHSKEAFNTLYQRLRKSAERGHELILVIKEAYK